MKREYNLTYNTKKHLPMALVITQDGKLASTYRTSYNDVKMILISNGIAFKTVIELKKHEMVTKGIEVCAYGAPLACAKQALYDILVNENVVIDARNDILTIKTF